MQPIIPPSNNDRKASEPQLLLPEGKSDSKIKFERPILKHLDKILFATSSIYLIIVIFWLANKNTLKSPWRSQNTNETIIKTNQNISKSDAEFIKYMSKSLAAIERRKKTAKKQTNETIKTAQTKIIERIYIPVSVAEETASQPNNSNRLRVPTPPPIKGKPTLFPAQTSSEEIATIKESNDRHVLVGLLELGENSVALFSINGDTRRIKIGQKIGQSGWTLIGAANRVAKISRNGKIRSISTGEEI